MKIVLYAVDRILILTFLVYVLLGNMPRLLTINGLPSSVNVVELILVLAGFLVLSLRLRRFLSIGKILFLFVSLYFCFTIVNGVMSYGYNIVAIAYAVRLASYIMVGFTLGVTLAYVFDGENNSFVNYFISVSVVCALLGLIILYFFPDSTVLWKMLSSQGIGFSGDPHQNRLIGLFLDPNYYSSILAFPFLLSFYIYIVHRKIIYLGSSLFIFLTIFLSGSRSGIACAILPIIGFATYNVCDAFWTHKVKRSFLIFSLLSFIVTMAAFFIYGDRINDIYNRTMGVSDPSSSQNRIDSFNIGLDLIRDRPFIGYGYNFSYSKLENLKGNSSLDSSIQMLVLSFGIPAASVLFFAIAYMLALIANKRNAGYFNGSYLQEASIIYIIYFIVILLFATNVNNILLYPHWLIIYAAFGSYFFAAYRIKKRGSNRMLRIQNQRFVVSRELQGS